MSGLGADDLSAAFDRAAVRYDRMVGLNPGYHRHLGAAAAALLDALEPVGGGRKLRLLDLGCGSGASTRALVQELDRRDLRAEVIGIDASSGMLLRARQKSWPMSVRFLPARAEELRRALTAIGISAVDGVLAAYLFRNVTDADATLRQVHEALRPGGALMVQEYSVAGSRTARRRWTAVCRMFISPLSLIISGNPALYRYLWRSVLKFDSIPVFAARMSRAGFVGVGHRTVSGWQRGILHLVRGRRSSGADALNP